MLRALLFLFAATAALGFQLAPARPVRFQPRHAPAELLELPELPKLPSLPSLPGPLADLLAYTPQSPKKNTNEFDKNGRLVKGPAVTKNIKAQETADNTKGANGAPAPGTGY